MRNRLVDKLARLRFSDSVFVSDSDLTDSGFSRNSYHQMAPPIVESHQSVLVFGHQIENSVLAAILFSDQFTDQISEKVSDRDYEISREIIRGRL